jgi:adenylate cyclase
LRRLRLETLQPAATARQNQEFLPQQAFQMHTPARILIVDDNEANRQILVTRLSKHGYEILQAADGEEALASASQHQPDLMLLDVEMPKLDGFEVCRRLKKDPRL